MKVTVAHEKQQRTKTRKGNPGNKRKQNQKNKQKHNNGEQAKQTGKAKVARFVKKKRTKDDTGK
jgi:hypothetical protein